MRRQPRCGGSGRHVVQIEPGLRPQSPENGNFSKTRRRLSAISPSVRSNSEPRDQQPICKSPPLAGFSVTIEGKFSEGGTAWLISEDSNSHIPVWKKPFDMSVELLQIYRNPGSETLAATSCALESPTRSGIRGPQATVDLICSLMIADQNGVCA